MRGRVHAFAATAALAALAGCGYHVIGTADVLPAEVRTLAVGEIDNGSREYGYERIIAFALEREIAVRRRFALANQPAGADAVLSGRVVDVYTRPVAFGANDQAVQYEVSVVIDLTLVNQRDGTVLWQAQRLREIDEYSASATVVVTSSSEFQQGLLDAVDINNPQFATIQLAETLRQRALNRLAAQTARDVYDQMMEGF
ncbi:LPS assembly lipoprotein LptE [Candidatus Binatia bacterium]|nr:LPS assembly lipoprotein LptE [Candidatus Binatia bacterium]